MLKIPIISKIIISILLLSYFPSMCAYKLRTSISMSLNGNNNNQGDAKSLNTHYKGLIRGVSRGVLGAAILSGYSLVPQIIDKVNSKSSGYPIFGPDDIMKKKEHGTSEKAVQDKLRWGCEVALADKICNFNRNWAEFAGYWSTQTSFLSDHKDNSLSNEVTIFYDSVTGLPLFKSPIGRSYNEWKDESLVHGWPSFRDSEVIWDNVRALKGGEMVSLTGTHLGHNLPDRNGNRYCINLVSIAGYPNNNNA